MTNVDMNNQCPITCILCFGARYQHEGSWSRRHGMFRNSSGESSSPPESKFGTVNSYNHEHLKHLTDCRTPFR